MVDISGYCCCSRKTNFFLLFIGIFLLNFFACAACTFGDNTMISFSFGLVVFVAVMVSAIQSIIVNCFFGSHILSIISNVCVHTIFVLLVSIAPAPALSIFCLLVCFKTTANLWSTLIAKLPSILGNKQNDINVI